MDNRWAEIVHQLQSIEAEIRQMIWLIEAGQDCPAIVRRGLSLKRRLGVAGLALIEGHVREEATATLSATTRTAGRAGLPGWPRRTKP